MKFISSLNILNYSDFESVAHRLREVSQILGLGLIFQQLNRTYSVILKITYNVIPSVEKVDEFLDKLQVLHQSTE